MLEANVEFENEQQRYDYLHPTSPNASQNIETKSSVWKTKSFVTLSDVFNETYAKFLSRKSMHKYPKDQVQFLADCE